MAINDDEAPCRTLAYGLWETAGGPDGADLEYWTQAQALLNGAGLPAERLRPMNVDTGGVEAGQAENRTMAP